MQRNLDYDLASLDATAALLQVDIQTSHRFEHRWDKYGVPSEQATWNLQSLSDYIVTEACLQTGWRAQMHPHGSPQLTAKAAAAPTTGVATSCCTWWQTRKPSQTYVKDFGSFSEGIAQIVGAYQCWVRKMMTRSMAEVVQEKYGDAKRSSWIAIANSIISRKKLWRQQKLSMFTFYW